METLPFAKHFSYTQISRWCVLCVCYAFRWKWDCAVRLIVLLRVFHKLRNNVCMCTTVCVCVLAADYSGFIKQQRWRLAQEIVEAAQERDSRETIHGTPHYTKYARRASWHIAEHALYSTYTNTHTYEYKIHTSLVEQKTWIMPRTHTPWKEKGRDKSYELGLQIANIFADIKKQFVYFSDSVCERIIKCIHNLH